VGYERDHILKVWDESIGRLAQKRDDPTDEELAAATAEVCAKCPGLKREEINAALASHVEEMRADNARIEQALKNVDRLFGALPEGTNVEDAIRTKAEQGDETAQVFAEWIDRLRAEGELPRDTSSKKLPGLPGGPDLSSARRKH
jgi:hypothetical protein